MLLLFCFMFLSGLFMFCFYHHHLILSLFSLEFLVVTLVFILFKSLIYLGLDFYFILMFLVFSVCEGALGLGIIVNVVRSHGNDYLSSVSVLSW